MTNKRFVSILAIMFLLFAAVFANSGCGGGSSSSHVYSEPDNDNSNPSPEPEPEPIPEPEISFTVTFNSNGGTSVASQTVKSGEKAVEPTAPIKDGYIFGGWYSDSALTERFSFNIAITSNITLYAKWNAPSVTTYTVTFNSNGGSSVQSQNVVIGEQAVLPADPTREGYTFIGWFVDQELTEQFMFSSPITKNITLYAKWEAKSTPSPKNSFMVTFNSNGGSAVSSQNVVSGDTAVMPETPTFENHIFVGWYTNDKFDEMFLFGESGDIISQDIQLYARWFDNNTDSLLIEHVLSEIEIEYKRGDNSNCVTQNIELPTTIYGVNIAWNSSKPSVISNAGVVVRPQGNDEEVILTATASRGSASGSSEFTINVLQKLSRPSSDVPTYTVFDIQNMNSDDVRIHYDDDKTQVLNLEGKFSNLTITNATDALSALHSIRTILGIKDAYEELDINLIHSNDYGSKYLFSQFYNGVRVFGRGVTVSANPEGVTNFLSSNFCTTYVSGTSYITQNRAEEIAKNYHDGNFTVASDQTEQIIYSIDNYETSPVYAWIVRISGTDGNGHYLDENVFVNASNGEVIIVTSNIMSSNEVGWGKNELGKKVSFDVNLELTNVRVVSSGDSRYYYATPVFFMTDTALDIDVYSGDLSPNNRVGHEDNNSWNDKQQISAYTNIQEVVRWWKNTFNRRSLDNHDMKIRIVTHQTMNRDADGNIETDNACWSPSRESFFIYDKKNIPNSMAVALDIMTHESAHAVMEYVVGFEFTKWYCNIPGAINEGYADIFGCLKERNWKYGEALFSGGWYNYNCDRNIESPNDSKALEKGPDRLSSNIYVNYKIDASDNGGVHTNSLLVSHSAYLMKKYGLSWETLEKLWYQSMFEGVYRPTSGWHDVRTAVLWAADDIHLSDDEKNIIKRAFDEVEIFASTGVLRGKVTDYDTGNNVADAQVTAYQNSIIPYIASRDKTDANGDYFIKLEPARYPIHVAKSGYVTLTACQIIEESEDLTMNVRLVRPGTGSVTGKILNAVDNSPIAGVSLDIKSGWNMRASANPATYNVIATTMTDSEGNYSFALGERGAGYYTIDMKKDGYVESSFNITVSGATAGQNGYMSPEMSGTEYRVVLTWGVNPRDLDSHLVGDLSDGSRFHVYYSNKNGYNAQREVVANLDIDDTSGEGPETITFTADAESTYTYYVRWYSGSGTWGSSEAKVSIFNGVIPVAAYTVPNWMSSSSGGNWNVFRLANGILSRTDANNTDSSNVRSSAVFEYNPPK